MKDNEQGKGEIRFLLATGMPLGIRLWWIVGLVLAGVALQMLVSVFLGWLMVLAGALLGMIEGRTTKPEVAPSGEWENITIEELKAVQSLSERIAYWRSRIGLFNADSSSGCMSLLLSIVVLAFCGILIWLLADRHSLDSGASFFPLIPALKGGLITPVFVIDAATMLIPVWFFGRLSAWEPPELPRKANYLLNIYDIWKADANLEFAPSLHVHKKEDVSVPTDCRLLVKFRDAPKDFVGIQIQVSINHVQGTAYPYCYAVIIARKPFGIGEKALRHLARPEQLMGWLVKLARSDNDRKEASLQRFRDSIVEITSESDVDVVVVRQVTIGTGYHTTESQAQRVFADAVELSKRILANDSPRG